MAEHDDNFPSVNNIKILTHTEHLSFSTPKAGIRPKRQVSSGTLIEFRVKRNHESHTMQKKKKETRLKLQESRPWSSPRLCSCASGRGRSVMNLQKTLRRKRPTRASGRRTEKRESEKNGEEGKREGWRRGKVRRKEKIETEKDGEEGKRDGRRRGKERKMEKREIEKDGEEGKSEGRRRGKERKTETRESEEDGEEG